MGAEGPEVEGEGAVEEGEGSLVEEAVAWEVVAG